jgi:hypothetical protein
MSIPWESLFQHPAKVTTRLFDVSDIVALLEATEGKKVA